MPALICAGLGLITLALYLPSIRHAFLDYDDQEYVTENAHVTGGLTARNVEWAFGFHAGNWHPLAWLSHMLDCQIYGLNPAGHHFTNVLLHSANTVLLFVLLFHLTGTLWRSAGVAALFGWHPLHVESVAWVAERKDVLCVFFGLLLFLAYARYAQASQARSSKAGIWYFVAVVLFALALMSKPMAVTFPFILLLLDYWPLRRVRFGNQAREGRSLTVVIFEKAPFFVLTFASCLLTIKAQKAAIVSTSGLSVASRLGHAMLSYAHYVGALFWPHDLAVYYPYETAVASTRLFFAAAFLILVTAATVWAARSRAYVTVGWLWFVGTLVPVIGLVQVGDQAWADRYTYLPSIGIFVIAVWGIAEVMRNRPALVFCSVVVGVALLADTSWQLRYWRNTRTLFEQAAKVVPNNYMAITMLGSLDARANHLDEAIKKYRLALGIKPGFPEAHFFLGNALDKQGKLDEAIHEYEQALWFKPIMATTHVLLGAALAREHRFEEAVAHYRTALKLEPDSAIAYNNLARVLQTQGKLDEAIAEYSEALKLDPKLAEAHNNLGIAYLQEGRTADGAAELYASLRLNPTNAESQFNLALALNEEKQWKEAAELFGKTVMDNSRDADAHYQFGVALSHLGKARQAMSQYAGALLLQPDFPDALDSLAWIISTSPDAKLRNPEQAVGMAERACELTGRKDPAKLKTLGAAYAEAGRFKEAVEMMQSAHDLAMAAKRDGLAQECETMSKQFQDSRPWRDDAETNSN